MRGQKCSVVCVTGRTVGITEVAFLLSIRNSSDVGRARSSNDNNEETRTGSNRLPQEIYQQERQKQGGKKEDTEVAMCL